jgi:hypothetical protein
MDGASVDPSVPGCKKGEQPAPVPLNFGSGGNSPLRMELYPNQPIDVGFLRIFLCTKYGDLSSIAQDEISELCEGSTRAHARDSGSRASRQVESAELKIKKALGIWDVITLPLIQRADWD